MPDHQLSLSLDFDHGFWVSFFEALGVASPEHLFHRIDGDGLSLHLSVCHLLLVQDFLKSELLLLIVVFEIVKQLCG